MNKQRLIDANDLIEKATTQFDWNDCVDVEDIKAAPTINPFQWISVKDKMPEDTDIKMCEETHMKFCSVLAYSKTRGVYIANRYITWATGISYIDTYEESKGYKNNVWCWGNNAEDITHWMPLPDSPEEN